MKKGGIRVFEDERKLKDMLEMRAKGYSYSSLGRTFGVDHTSIMYWCKKYGIKEGKKPQKLPSKKKIQKGKLLVVKKEKTNPAFPMKSWYKEELQKYERKTFIRDEKGNLIKAVVDKI